MVVRGSGGAGCGMSRWGGWLFLVFPRRSCAPLGFPVVEGSREGLCGLVGGCVSGVLGLLVENCIVDASILKRSNF